MAVTSGLSLVIWQETVGPISTRGGILLQRLGLSAAPIIRIHTGRSRFLKHSGPRTLVDLVAVIGSQNGTVRLLPGGFSTSHSIASRSASSRV